MIGELIPNFASNPNVEVPGREIHILIQNWQWVGWGIKKGWLSVFRGVSSQYNPGPGHAAAEKAAVLQAAVSQATRGQARYSDSKAAAGHAAAGQVACSQAAPWPRATKICADAQT